MLVGVLCHHVAHVCAWYMCITRENVCVRGGVGCIHGCVMLYTLTHNIYVVRDVVCVVYVIN